MAMFKKFYESATPIKAEEMENNTLKLVGPAHSTGERDFSCYYNRDLADIVLLPEKNVLTEAVVV